MVMMSAQFSALRISMKFEVLRLIDRGHYVRLTCYECAIPGLDYVLPQILKVGASLQLSSVLMQRLSIFFYLQVIVKIKLLLRCCTRKIFYLSVSRMLISLSQELAQRESKETRKRRGRKERMGYGLGFGMAITIIIKFQLFVQDYHGEIEGGRREFWYFSECINSFIIISMEADWQLPEKKQYPLYVSFDPLPTDHSDTFLNPFLGYPNCPIIGRYNRGEYKIGETLMQIEFKCRFDKQANEYRCGDKRITLPQFVQFNIRNIPEIIPNHKQAALKNSPDFLPQKYPVRDDLSVFWVVSFGQIGKDFLNYLNHMYILANTLFQEEKLKREIHYLPIFAHLPHSSGLHPQEVERGLNFSHFRGEYMSFHLNKGAPAFSPNNMRLGVEGGKIVTTKPPPKNKKEKPKYVEKQKQQKQKKQVQKQAKEEQFVIDWQQIENKPIPKGQPAKKQQPKGQKQAKHQGFVHFYTALLLENEHRVYYHWHIDDQYKEEILKELLRSSATIDDFLSKYSNILGKDCLYFQTSRLFSPQNL